MDGEAGKPDLVNVIRRQFDTEGGGGRDAKSGFVRAWSAGFEPTQDTLEDGPVRAGSAHAAVPEEEACVGLDHPEGVATGAWRVGHGVVDVGFWGGIGFEIFAQKQSRQLKNDGDLKRAGDNVPEELERIEL